jgi:hypothetical protein
MKLLRLRLGLFLVLALAGCNYNGTTKQQIKDNTTNNLFNVSNETKIKTNQGKHLGQKKHQTAQENMWTQATMNTDFRQWIQTTGIQNLDMNQTHVGAYRNTIDDPVTGQPLRDPNTEGYLFEKNWYYFFSFSLKNNDKLTQAQYDMIKNHIVAHYNAKVTQETNYIYEQYDNHVIHVDLINDVYNLATP